MNLTGQQGKHLDGFVHLFNIFALKRRAIQGFVVLHSIFTATSLYGLLNIFSPASLHIEQNSNFLNLEGRFRFSKLVSHTIMCILI